MDNIIDRFKAAMAEAGIEPPADIIADGRLHRFNSGGKSKNSWYVLHADDPAAGAFGDWRRGISETWSCKSHQTMTSAEKAACAVKMETVKRLRDEELERLRTECRARSSKLWDEAGPAKNGHPYLVKKNVKSHGLRQDGDILLVPVLDFDETLHGLQKISPDGSKRFATGTAKAGHFFKIGQTKDDTVIVCEGFATGASIHAVTGQVVYITFDAGNLLSVAQTIRAKYSDMKIIVAADDDHMTEGNPGLAKATEAAKVVNGLLAIPIFPNHRGPKDSDFNDLARLSGSEAVRQCIEAASMPTSEAETSTTAKTDPLDEAVQRLAALTPLEYDRIRKVEAKELGVRPGTLDAAVKGARKGNASDDLPFEVVDPWPVAIDPAALLTDISATIRRFVVCGQETADAAALWVAMTWFIDVVAVAPLAVITAPEKECGKSLLLDLIGWLSARPITASNISPAALFRALDAWKPTLLIDEADTFMKDNEELRGLLNSGHTRNSAYVIRTVGEDFKPTKFNTWGAKVVCGIGHVADTLMSRAIVLELRRKLPHEIVERTRQADPGLFADLRSKLARFADDYKEHVKQARPPLPQTLSNRAADNWETLLSIAQVAGGDWLRTGTTAAVKLSGGENSTQTIGTELLADIQEIFKEKQINRITLSELVKVLCADEEKSWASYNRGFPIKPRQVTKRLSEYGIKSKPVRVGLEIGKGYEENQFDDAFSRYIPEKKVSGSHENPVTKLQPAPALDLSVTEAKPVTVTQSSFGYNSPSEMENVTEARLRNRSVTERKTSNVAESLRCNYVTDGTPLNAEIFLSEDDFREVTL